jgi:hypothetical protein
MRMITYDHYANEGSAIDALKFNDESLKWFRFVTSEFSL